jgi:hypothetical protein
MSEESIKDIRIVDKVPAWARAFGVLALVAAIVSVLVPVIGPIFITIPAAILGIIALIGGDRKLGITVFVIVAVNLIISPSFWLNFFAGATQKEASPNRWFAFLDIILSVGMIPFLFIKRK